jgi:hypothetical protein
MLLRKKSSNIDHQNIQSHVTAVPHLVGALVAWVIIYIQLSYDQGGPNNSFGENQKFKMPISHVKVYIVALWQTHYHLLERH